MGAGHKEIVYQHAFGDSLRKRNILFGKEKRILVNFESKNVGTYTADFIVKDVVIVELKAKKLLTEQDIDQFWHYLKGSSFKLGFLINFGSFGGVTIIRRVYDTARQQ